MIYIAVIFFLIHNHADFLLQAYQHGWKTYWKLYALAPKWDWWLDWIPHDSWHIVQWIRNASVIAGTAICVYEYQSWWFVIPFVLYSITRGIGFSIPLKLSKK
jgi:hypothetical protein